MTPASGDPVTLVRAFNVPIRLVHLYWSAHAAPAVGYHYVDLHMIDDSMQRYDSVLIDDEGVAWIKGHVYADSPEGAALLAAFTLTHAARGWTCSDCGRLNPIHARRCGACSLQLPA